MEPKTPNTMETFKAWFTSHKDWLRLGAKLISLAVIMWAIFGLCFGFTRISSPAMSNRLEDGDLVLYSKLVNEYHSDDVIIYEHDGKTYVSSILAKADDLIEIDQYGHLFLNGTQVSDDIAYTPEQRDLIGPSTAFRVPDNSYYVVNENLNSIEDSRSFGAIPYNSIKGKIIGVLRTRSI